MVRGCSSCSPEELLCPPPAPCIPHSPLHPQPHTLLAHHSPSMRTLKTSLRMVKVEPRTKTEKKRVLMGSAILHWGCGEQGLCEAGHRGAPGAEAWCASAPQHPAWGSGSCSSRQCSGVQPWHLEVDDGGSHKDTEALQQVPHHVDEGRTDAGAAGQGGTAGQTAPSALQLLISPRAMAVTSGGLVQDVGHAGESRAGSAPWCQPCPHPHTGSSAHTARAEGAWAGTPVPQESGEVWGRVLPWGRAGRAAGMHPREVQGARAGILTWGTCQGCNWTWGRVGGAAFGGPGDMWLEDVWTQAGSWGSAWGHKAAAQGQKLT